MKLFYKIISYLLVPYPIAFIVASLLTFVLGLFFEEVNSNDLRNYEAVPGIIIVALIIIVVQFILGTLPILILRKLKVGLVGFLVVGIAVATLSVWRLSGGDSDWQLKFFLTAFYCGIVGGYFLMYQSPQFKIPDKK